MGQATVDLPDPLQNSGSTPATNADDLLAQLAGDEIDRLLAESDGDPTSSPKPDAAVAEPAPTEPINEPVPIGDVLAEIDENSATFEAPEIDETGLIEKSQLNYGLPMDAAENELDLTGVQPMPVFLRPLVWLNAPFAALPEGLRDAMGKIAILTMINAIAVIGYVVLFKRHHG